MYVNNYSNDLIQITHEMKDVYFKAYLGFINNCFISHVRIYSKYTKQKLKTQPISISKHSDINQGYYTIKYMQGKAKETFTPISYLYPKNKLFTEALKLAKEKGILCQH